MAELIIIILFCIHNSRIATRKGLPATPWILRTIVAIMCGAFIASIFIMMSYKGSMDFMSVQRYLMQNPLKILTAWVLEAGGGLLVKYLLERKPDPKQE